ncbi:MAG: hypothetical protein LBE56_07155 [Tannerella sp.]|nr:hypothetical protein [Tannerella sp.]
MKPLLITFFIAILCYSLFFERKEEMPIHIDEINYSIQVESFDTLQVSDQSTLFTLNLQDFYLMTLERE